jgi:cellulose synthase (UDP-forming)
MRLPWAVGLLLLLAARYVHWRVSSTLVFDDTLVGSLSVLVLLAELWLLGHSFLQLLFSLAPDPGIRARVERAAVVLEQRLPEGRLPAVDVLIPTYGEPVAVVERCLRGCLALDYPRFTVWLLDDAARPELAALCRALGCRYSARQDRRHAKAGNLNHVLPELRGDLIAVFDADVVPLGSFLRRSVGLFAEEQVGLVQTPQTYMNADPVIRNLRLERWLMPDEESFYRWIEPVRQGVGAVVCAGTSFLVRRSALQALGGFDTATSSEDLSTGIRLTAAGWECLFVPEKLSAGLAPFTVAAMARQRCRWASGTLQTLRSGANPLTIPGLTPLQRIAFLEGILHWFNALPQLLLALTPLAIGLFGVLPLQVSADGLLRYALPFFAAQLLLARWFSGHARTGLLPELYRWTFLLPLVATIARWLWRRPAHFQVTPKGLARGRVVGADPRLWVPLLGLLVVQLVALVNLLGFTRDPSLPDLDPISPASLALGLVWSGLNSLLLALALRSCWDRPCGSELPWFSLQAPAHLNGLPCRLGAISEEGVELTGAQLSPGATAVLRWGAAGPDAEPGGWPVRVEARRGSRVGCVWGDLSARQRELLQQQLYRQPGLWPQRRAPLEPVALLVVLARLFQPLPPDGWFRRSLLPIRLGLGPLPKGSVAPQPLSRLLPFRSAPQGVSP